jgi:hypothetical protein
VTIAERVAAPDPSRRAIAFAWGHWAIAASVILGAVLRTQHYLAARPLWLDEAMLGVNVTQRTPAQLWSAPLEFLQVAPYGYLLLEWLMARMNGAVELALRLPSFVAGVGVLGLIAWLAARLLPIGAAALVTLLAAVSPSLVFYSTQAKPYALDAMLALVVTIVGMHFHEQPPPRRHAIRWGAFLGVLAWLSAPIAFVIVAIGLATRQLAFLVVAGLTAVPALLHMRTYAEQSGGLDPFWASGYPPWSLDVDLLAWFARLPARMAMSPLHWSGPAAIVAIGLGALLWGAWKGWTSARWRIVLAPIGVALAVACVRVYPFGAATGESAGRVILYLVPSLLLLAGYGVAEIARTSRAVGLAVGSGLAATALAGFLAAPYRFTRTDVPTVLGYIREHRQPGDRLFVHFAASAEVQFYDPTALREGRYQPEQWLQPDDCCPGIMALPPGRAWMLYSYLGLDTVLRWEQREGQLLRLRGIQLDSVVSGHSMARLYKLR